MIRLNWVNYSLILLGIFLFWNCSTEKQIIKKGRKHVEILCSEEFAGRGYTDNGMEKAANYIAKAFEKYGLQTIDDSYFQEFDYPINVIESAELSINGKKLEFGKDFLVNPSAKSEKYVSKKLNVYELEKSKENKFQKVFISDNSKISIQYFAKLIYSLSNQNEEFVMFFINDSTCFKNSSIQVEYSIKSKLIDDFKAKNVIGKIEGENQDSTILVTAHYDHLGKVGNAIFSGANDNASGVAFILSLAKYFSKHKPKYNLVFIAFAGEEAGLKGSQYFVDNPLVDLSKIKFLLNFDIMGTGDDGVQIVNSSVYKKEYELLSKINEENNYLKQIKKRGKACNSDHCPFDEKGIPAFFTYTLGGITHYHDIYDKAETLPLTEFVDLNKLFIEFLNRLE